jgi:hypothetical protein
MPLDYGAVLFAPIYLVYGVEAVLTLQDTAGTQLTLTVIDMTDGIETGDGVDVGTVVPGAVFQLSELTGQGFARADLDRASITFNGGTWKIVNHVPKPVPSGEANGEILLTLEETNV